MNQLEVKVTGPKGVASVFSREREETYNNGEIYEIARNAIINVIIPYCVFNLQIPNLNDYECNMVSKFKDGGDIKFRFKLKINGNLATASNGYFVFAEQLVN
jgi:hypothetical protein